MIDIGKMNQLRIVKKTDFGFFLEGDDGDEILLPKRYITKDMKVDDALDVFIYMDSEDRIIATTETPLAMVGDFAFLKVVDVRNVGAFMDWGLSKDLFVPFAEQQIEMLEGESYVVMIYEDNSGRIAASSKLDKYMSRWPANFEDGQKVDLLICERTDLGYKAIIERKKWGLLYTNELFQELNRGQEISGYIKKMRSDDKIDISLQKPAFEKNKDLLNAIIDHLKKNGGHSTLTDKCSPSEIYKTFKVSKSQYKNTLGMLYKQKMIKIEKNEIYLLAKIDES